MPATLGQRSARVAGRKLAEAHRPPGAKPGPRAEEGSTSSRSSKMSRTENLQRRQLAEMVQTNKELRDELERGRKSPVNGLNAVDF